MNGKNLRLLGREESPARQSSIQEMIDELQKEIARRETVYTPDELQVLERKLADYERMLINLLGP